MADEAHVETDKKLEKMERHLSAIYRKADREIKKTAADYFKQFERMDKERRKLVQAGKMSEADYMSWRKGKLLYGKRYTEMREQIAAELLNVNKTAMAYINDQLPEVYALNYNQLDGQISGYSFTLTDPYTVKHLAESDKNLLPYKYVDGKKDVRWNVKKVNSAVLQGILQGKSIPHMADTLEQVTEMNRTSAIRNARTTVTSAENKGRQDSFVQAEKDGIRLKREWMATEDGRTRHSHRLLDGQQADVDKPFESELGPIMYPGDPTAAPANVYNCRCTLVSRFIGFAKKGAQAAQEAAGKAAQEVKAFVSEKLKAAMGADFEPFAKILEKSKTLNVFQKFSDQLKAIKVSTKSSYYQPATDSVFFEWETHDGLNRYGVLAHEMGHSFDERVANAVKLNFTELEKINERCKISFSSNFTLRRVASSSDDFLSAMRKDKAALNVYNTSLADRERIHDDLMSKRNTTSGIQDAMDGFFGTQGMRGSGFLPWGHGNAYYNRFYTRKIKPFGLDKELKKIYKEMGFDASNQAKTAMISRDYETASELWANITSAYTVQGDELEYMRKYMPNACEAYEKILGGLNDD